MRARRRVLAAGLAAMLLAAGPAAGRPLDDVVAAGSLIVAVYRDYPPFSYDTATGLAGIDVDIAQAIAAALGIALELKPVTAGERVDDDLRNVIWKGHYLDPRLADLMLHVPVDRQFALRNDQAVIFGPYFLRRIAVAYDGEALGADVEPALVAAGSIAVELDSLADFFLTSAFGGQLRDKVVHFRTTSEAVAAFRSGEVAAVMAPQSEIEWGLGADRPGVRIAPVAMGGFARPVWPVGAAVKEDSRDLRYAVEDVIAAMIADGRMAAIFARYNVSYRPPEAP